MTDWGSVPLGSVLPFFFSAFDGGTGASITMTGIAVTDVEIYKGTSMTQRSSDAGVVLLDTDGIDVDGITGIHGFSIDTGDNTDASFFVAGSFFTVVVASVTIDAQTVNFVAGTFRLVAAESVAGVVEVDLTHIAGAAVSAASAQLGVNVIQAAGTAWGSGAITAGSIATDAIGAAELADGAITAATFAAGAIDATAIANGAIDAATFAAGAIDAAAIAAGAIDAATFAADVDAEILSYIVDDATRIDASALNTASVTTTPAILVDTAEIGAAGAGLTALASQASVTTVDDLLDSEMPALTTAVAAVKTQTDKLVFTVANQLDSNILSISGDATAADRLEALMDGVIIGQVNDAAATTTAFAADGFTEATDDHFNGRLITFLTGALVGQQTAITDYDAAGHVQGDQTLVVSALTEAPAENVFFVIH